jgi:hypothetical protein
MNGLWLMDKIEASRRHLEAAARAGAASVHLGACGPRRMTGTIGAVALRGSRGRKGPRERLRVTDYEMSTFQ